jgi:cell division septum initiation protein DivIVA
MGYIGIGGGLGTFAASVVSRKKHARVAEHYVSQMYKDYDGELTDKESQIYQLTDTVQDLKGTIQSLQNETAKFPKLAEKIEFLTRQNESKDNIIEQVTGELDRLIQLARTAVEESLGEWETKLSSLVDTKKDQYPKLAERLNALLDEGQGKLADYALKLSQTPSKWDSLGDLLSLYYCLNDDLANVKTKIIQAIAKLTNQQTQHELQEVEEILEEWQTANLVPRDKLEHIIRNYEAALNEFRTDFSNRFDATHQFALALEGQTSEDDKFVQTILARMQELEAKIHQLSKPLRYLNATRSDMVIANIIIGYFERLGIILDRAGTDYRGYEATLEFITDRTGRLVLASELNEHVDRLQPLTHALNQLEFKLDPETGLMTLLVRWGNKPAANTTEQSKRLVSPLADVVKRLIEGLSHKPTIRIMGATGEGKGVMARYLLNQVLTSNPWYCRLHDPQHGSSEDYWGIPKVSRSGSELKKALKDIESQMISREATKNWSVVTLDILDEIDTHLEKKEKKESFIDLVSRIRHLGMKLILIGQNPKVGRAGFEWSDMQQMNCIYMGASALDAIEANPQLKPRKDKLTKEYITLSEHYERENDGLDDGEKYLFGLVVIPGKTPLWVELPRPDSIKVDCEELLLGKTFDIPNSFSQLI